MLKLSNKKDFLLGFSQKEIATYSVQFLAIFFMTFSLLFLLGLVPEELRNSSKSPVNDIKTENENVFSVLNNTDNTQNQNTVIQDTYTRPDRVVISKIGVDSQIQKPDSANVNVLDEALRYGAVHYPGSGSMEGGNIFLFGHSTGFKVVQNQAYKTFNNLNKLVAGDEIILYAGGKEYIYSVEQVLLVDENDTSIDLSKQGNRLTISTCNTFGAKQERWVAEAVLK